jgi:hypothetical protein
MGGLMTDSERHDPKGESAEWEGPRSSYAVVKSEREISEPVFTTAEPIIPSGEGAYLHGQNGNGGSPIFNPSTAEARKELDRRPAPNQTKLYAALGVGLGLLAALAIVAFFVHQGGSDGSTDLGYVTSSPFGLKGHLVAKWTDRLEYHLSVEPADPAQRAAFSYVVTNSPRPLSVEIQLKSALGQVLCGNAIVLKFDPRKAPRNAAADSEPKARKTSEVDDMRDQIAQSVNLARLESQELTREHGKDVFLDDIGPGGQITSINALGSMPCSQGQFLNTVSWTFTPNFLTVAQQAELLNRATGLNPNGQPLSPPGSAGKGSDALQSSSSGKTKRRPASAVSFFSIEGDDALVGYDASTGTIESRTGKAFLIDRKDAVSSALKGRDLPVAIHYVCDQRGACTVAGISAGVQRARLKQ